MNGYQNYARTSIKTADPRSIVVLLYEGIINFLNQAQASLEAGDKAGMSDGIGRAQRIIHHLASALDFEQGGEIAQNLANLYNYMRDTLTQGNIRCDATKINEVCDLTRPLLDAWRKVANDPAAAAVLQRPHEDSAQASNTDILKTEGAGPEDLAENQIDVVEHHTDVQSSDSGFYSPTQKSNLSQRQSFNTLAARSAYGIQPEA